MKITFLGTNGWYSTETGNTPCILIETDERYIVLDAGDGFYKLDRYIKDEKPIYVFLSHFHLEHILGLHILAKFNFKQKMYIYGQKGAKKVVGTIAASPYTMALKELPFEVEVNELGEGSHTEPFPIECKFLLHKDPCYGYRFDLDGKTITYCTDTAVCENDLELSKNADVLIHECSLRPGVKSGKWPHTNPEEAAELAKKANVKKLVLFHFDAKQYTDLKQRDEAENVARRIFKNTIASRDGMQIDI